jgi:hypothetical protein
MRKTGEFSIVFMLAVLLIIASASVSTATVPDVGPPAGATATIVGEPDTTIVAYKTPKVWEDLHPDEIDIWLHGKAASIKTGTKVMVLKQANPEEPSPLLVQVQILEGEHSGESWWIASQFLKSSKMPAKKPTTTRKLAKHS